MLILEGEFAHEKTQFLFQISTDFILRLFLFIRSYFILYLLVFLYIILKDVLFDSKKK